MKHFLLAVLLTALTGCAGLRPYGGADSARLDLPGAAGLSAVAWLDRLPDGLLVTVDVQDDQIVAVPDRPLWESDSVEFYADLRPYRERVLLNRYGRGVFQMVVRAPSGRGPAQWQMLSYGFPVPEGIAVKTARTAEGYRVQMFLPEKTFREIHGPFRDILYVDVAVNDADAAGGSGKIFWKGNRDNWQHPHDFAPVTLPRK